MRGRRTKRNHNNEEYLALLQRVNEWQGKHPGQRIPARWQKQLRQISKRYATWKQGQRE